MATAIREDLYVNDLLKGRKTIEQVQQYREANFAVFRDATLELYKWHSNIEELDGGDQAQDSEKTFVKQSSGAV